MEVQKDIIVETLENIIICMGLLPTDTIIIWFCRLDGSKVSFSECPDYVRTIMDFHDSMIYVKSLAALGSLLRDLKQLSDDFK